MINKFIVIRDEEHGYQIMEKIVSESTTRWITSSHTQISKKEFNVWGNPALKVWKATQSDFANVERMKKIRHIKKMNLDRLSDEKLDEVYRLLNIGKKGFDNE
ncbi:MAG: Unknown protein [uncultured Sulfurovum sp.]|uniref:Uncharacterized protein n=1 Tax=uncultured Sulfurovum sp. TaxID=269237 RepID=A0A6S6SH00_9BACT|nr:MAG: Unknown protein [uncultured Sulfurovum sp.]